MKKFIVLFIVVAVILSGLAAFLQFRRIPYKYGEVDNGYELKKYTGISTEKSVKISQAEDGKDIIAINDFAVSNNDYLEEIFIGKSVLNITEWAITNNRKLQKITVDPENPNFRDIDGVLYNKLGDTLIVYPNSKDLVPVKYEKESKPRHEGNYTVPEGVKNISRNAFYKCKNLTTVTLPTTLKTIGDMAFHECDYLKTMVLPEGIVSIGIDSFSYNGSMTGEIILPSTLKEIGDYAFFSSQKLAKIIFNASESFFNENVIAGKKWIPTMEKKMFAKVPFEFR